MNDYLKSLGGRLEKPSTEQSLLREFVHQELGAFTREWHAWYLLALQDIKGRYRRSVIGPFWITLTSIFFVIGLGLVYSRLLNLDLNEYLPYLACGIITWTFILTFIIEGASSIISAGHIIKQLKLPIHVHVMRTVFRNLIIFLHSWIILIPLLIWYGHLSVYGLLASLIGIALIVFMLTPVVTLLALLCARYRDVLPMITSIMQLLFFVTPVMWHPDQIAGLGPLMKYNIFVYLIDLVRVPMLYGNFPFTASLIILALGCGLWVLAFLALFINRKHIPYWV